MGMGSGDARRLEESRIARAVSPGSHGPVNGQTVQADPNRCNVQAPRRGLRVMKNSGICGLLVVTVLASGSANVAVTVIGNGLGANCYKMAEFGGDPARGVQICTLAIEQESLSVSDRAATYINRGILRSRGGNADGA